MKSPALILIATLAAPALAQNSPPARDPGLQKIVQIAIVTRDIEASAKRWSALLGMPVNPISTTRPGREVRMVVVGKPSDAQVKLTFFKLGQVVLELMQPLGGESSWQRGLDRNGESVHHIGFQVADLDGSMKLLESLGYKMEHRGRYDKDNGDYVYYDTEKALGVLVELLHSDPPPKQ
jgi:methylmalonyl-CoA/ethylmalonyl-CoA epimerase